MMRISSAIGLLSFAACLVIAQSTPARLEFKVASLKPASPSAMLNYGGIYRTLGHSGWVRFENFSLAEAIKWAYGFHDKSYDRFQLFGPKWIDSEMFDVAAKTPPVLPKMKSG